MPRPRYAAENKTALQKLDEAFWDCLRDMPYDKITIAILVKRAGVNRNTFYYHYENLSDFARSVVNGTALDPLVIRSVIADFLAKGRLDDADQILQADERVERVCLLAGDHSSAELRQMLRNAVENAWSEALEFKIVDLDLEGRLALEFLMGGFLAVIAYRANSGESYSLREMVDFGIPADAARLIRHIKKSSNMNGA